MILQTILFIIIFTMAGIIAWLIKERDGAKERVEKIMFMTKQISDMIKKLKEFEPMSPKDLPNHYEREPNDIAEDLIWQ